MKKYIVFCLLSFVLCPLSVMAKRQPKPQEVDSLGRKIKTGWNFGILPSVAYDADYGFQGGVLTNVYFYGDGSQYPEYIHSLYFEGAYTTKHHGIFRFNYDSKYLIPGYRLTLDATYLPDAMCDFYGFNGYESKYHPTWHNWKKDTAKMPGYEEYRTRVFYKYKRDLIRVAGDIEGTIYKDLKWNAGIGVLGYLIDDCDINMLNGKNVFDPSLQPGEQKALDPNAELLYDKYKTWGLIGADEMKGGWHPYLRGGITYDTRRTKVYTPTSSSPTLPPSMPLTDSRLLPVTTTCSSTLPSGITYPVSTIRTDRTASPLPTVSAYRTSSPDARPST